MSSFDYNTPIITALRSGNSDDPYVDKIDTLQIDINSKTTLTEIPVQLNRVQVSGQGVTWVEIQSGSPTANQYIIDYNNKIATFHSSRQGLQLTFTYKGRGLIYVPTSMIYTNSANGVVTQTLDQVVNAATNFTHRLEYNPSTLYSTYNIVSYIGITYMYTANTSSTGNSPNVTNSVYWTKIAGNANKGVYSTSTTYDAGDIVEDSTYHNVYQSLVNANLNQSLTNTAKWQPLISVQSAIDTITTTNTNVTNAESSRVTSEGGRVSAESTRVSQESSRVSTESSRVAAESTRVSQESTRVSSESTRQTNETARIGRDTAYQLIEVYSNTKAYVPLNKVTYSGSTYQCILATTGNAPTVTTYWILIAAAGANGAGTVASIVSTSNDILVAGTPQNPDLSVNTGTGANKIIKTDANGRAQVSDPSAIQDIATKGYTDKIKGTSNADITQLKSAILNTDTRSSVIAYDVSNRVATIQEKDGTTVIKTTTLAYNATTGLLETVTEVAGGVTVTTTLTYTSGALSNTTKAVS